MVEQTLRDAAVKPHLQITRSRKPPIPLPGDPVRGPAWPAIAIFAITLAAIGLVAYAVGSGW